MNKIELEMIDRKMDKNLDDRHTYLKFAFTITASLLGALFAFSLQKQYYWMILMPFVVIIPFQARITYARLIMAKYEAYIKIVYKEEVTFYHYDVYDLFGIMGKIIAIIVNYELILLSLMIDFFYFWILKPSKLLSFNVIVPLFLTGFVWLLATYSFHYGKFKQHYSNEFKKRMRQETKK